jgi:hypothetical protein
MELHLYLNKPNQEKSALMLTVTFDGKRLRSSTGISIQSNLWDRSKEKVKRSHSSSTKMNVLLDKIRSSIESLYHNLQAERKELTLVFIKEKRLYLKYSG